MFAGYRVIGAAEGLLRHVLRHRALPADHRMERWQPEAEPLHEHNNR